MSALGEQLVDQILLGNAECHDTQTSLGIHIDILVDQIHDILGFLAVGFGAVIEGPVHVVIVHADPGAVGLDRGEGDKIVVVEILIGEGDELFIAAAIMPFQADLGERGRADVQNGIL